MEGRSYALKWSAEYDTKSVTTYATAYGGTVMSCAVRSLYPRPAVILGVNNERLENGVDIPKYIYSRISVISILWFVREVKYAQHNGRKVSSQSK